MGASVVVGMVEQQSTRKCVQCGANLREVVTEPEIGMAPKLVGPAICPKGHKNPIDQYPIPERTGNNLPLGSSPLRGA